MSISNLPLHGDSFLNDPRMNTFFRSIIEWLYPLSGKQNSINICLLNVLYHCRHLSPTQKPRCLHGQAPKEATPCYTP